MKIKDFNASIFYKPAISLIVFFWAIACFLFGIISYIMPLLVNPSSNGMAFFGLSIAYLSLHFSFKEQVENAKDNEERDKRIIRIEKMVEKWDFN